MKLNVSKIEELRVCFSNLAPSNAPITIRGQDVDVDSEAKLLGVVISDDLKWNHHIDYICKKAAKRLYGLRLLKRNALPPDALISVCCTHVRSIVEYACQVYHYTAFPRTAVPRRLGGENPKESTQNYLSRG